MKNFTYEHDGTAYEFQTVNSKKLQLFQVYYCDGVSKKRFHMQVDDNDDFLITIKTNCPESVFIAEKHLSAAIKAYGSNEL